VSAGVGYALLSLIAAGVLDVVYGRFAGAGRSTGLYLIATGVVITIGQAFAMFAAGIAWSWDAATARWGLVAGAIVLVANAMLVKSLDGINVSLGSTIYRLNTIAVVVFAFAFLGEPATATKLGGVALGVTAVFLLYHRGGRGGSDRLLLVSVGIVIGAALLRAVFGIVSKVGLAAGADPFLFMLYIGVGWTLAAIVWSVVWRAPMTIGPGLLAYALSSGSLICLVATFLLLGLRTGEASVVIPIANMSFVVALTLSAATGMERLTRRKLIAIACAASAVALLTGA